MKINQQVLLVKIKNKRKHLNKLIEELKSPNKLNSKLIKTLQTRISIHHKKLAEMLRDLEAAEAKSDKILVSERLSMFFSIAKGLKPKLSEEIDKLLKK